MVQGLIISAVHITGTRVIEPLAPAVTVIV